MTKSEFVEKFNTVHDEFLNDPKTKELFISTFRDKKYTLEELVPVLMNTSIQLSSKFTFDVLSQVLEFDEKQ